MVKIETQLTPRVSQGDIIKNVYCIENFQSDGKQFSISQIIFPLAIVLTQDCDLEQDHRFRNQNDENRSQDKYLLSVLLAPIYNVEHIYTGEHMSSLGMVMTTIQKNRTPGTNLKNNETPRYHYLEFPADTHIAPSVIDFKQYFSMSVVELTEHKKSNFLCKLGDLYREDVSQRYSSYLSRIGLP